MPHQGPIHYDERLVPEYTLPDPLLLQNRNKITNAQEWLEKRRPEILQLFEQHMYGQTPDRNIHCEYRTISTNSRDFGGFATRKQVRLAFSENGHRVKLDLLLYYPNECNSPPPVFLGLNFQGNHSIQPDPEILLSNTWMREGPGIRDHHSTEASRGSKSSRWPVEHILRRGYALATAYYGDLDPDYDDGFENGVHPLFYQAGQTRPAANEWGAIGAWAWGLSRILDYLENEPSVDTQRVAVMGHSRLGKTALWAGAQDPRFAMVISNNSGCGGAALSRRAFGETVYAINQAFPHWFCENFKEYNQKVNELPIDQHMLVALLAPRPVYIASAAKDLWADPRGEFLAALHADPVYRLMDTDGLAVTQIPGLAQPVMSTIGYHIRPGKHDVTLYDWDQFMNFADRHLTLDFR